MDKSGTRVALFRKTGDCVLALRLISVSSKVDVIRSYFRDYCQTCSLTLSSHPT